MKVFILIGIFTQSIPKLETRVDLLVFNTMEKCQQSQELNVQEYEKKFKDMKLYCEEKDVN